MEFKKVISKHMKLQKRHGDLLYSHKELIDSYALLESAHEVMVTKVKDSQSHTCTCAPPSIDLSCANSCCSQVKPSCDEHVLVETYDSFIASENDELRRENEMLKMELSRLKGKGLVQPSQDNHNRMVKKLEKGSTITCAKLPQINLNTPYQKIDKHMLSALSAQPWDTSYPNIPTREMTKQSLLEDKEAYLKEGTLVAKKKTTI
jgi:hypothetical protein